LCCAHLNILEFLHTDAVLAIREEVAGGIHDCNNAARETMFLPYRGNFYAVVEVKSYEELLSCFVFDQVHGPEVRDGFHDFNEKAPMLDGPIDPVVVWIIVVPQIDVVVVRKLVEGREMVLKQNGQRKLPRLAEIQEEVSGSPYFSS